MRASGGLGTLALFLGFSAAAHADIALRLPVDCTPGTDCYLQNFVDHDPGPEWRDYTCGPLSYDGHKGTDFALPTRADLARGVSVLAAAPGTVRGVRDGMPDFAQGDAGAPDVTGKDCGNGVVLDHGGGWETQYCHLARGSVTVRPDDTVDAGQTLGRIGLSGRTQFPHLHLSVRKDGQVVDPFDPDGDIACGAPSGSTLWIDPIALQPGGVLDAGFAARVPDYAAVKAGTVDEDLTTDSPALVLFGLMFGTQAGDRLSLTIVGPEGNVFSNTVEMDRTQAQAFRAGGRRTPPEGWPGGEYTGTVVLERGAEVLSRSTVSISLD